MYNHIISDLARDVCSGYEKCSAMLYVDTAGRFVGTELALYLG